MKDTDRIGGFGIVGYGRRPQDPIKPPDLRPPGDKFNVTKAVAIVVVVFVILLIAAITSPWW